MHVWRISKAKFAEAAFTGEGARLFDGRWNFQGVPMVYTSSSLALAAVEFFVHLDPSDAPDDLVSLKTELPDGFNIERMQEDRLPLNWRRVDNRHLQEMGSKWVKLKSSVALVVPSAVVEEEWNVLLNPTHPDFAAIAVERAKPFRYDERMFKRV
ncbi:MAG TPA: RES family NAD+ phosphorylase [Bryobacteraceae bacterium]|nr:RES family NAD+ phosphorylase [Bryobacteraceae bacterium]